ncbi:MAG: nucleotidyltransferase family protein [Terracidiphilus sp.]
MHNLSGREWRHLLNWLDISGLALYFIDRIVELKLTDWLPPRVLARLQQNLADNTERSRGMIAESIAIQQAFQEARLSYANLKGLSFWPVSVPKPELRLQFDLDFLVAAECIPEARGILERRGYRMRRMSGRSWEFWSNERPWLSMKDIYKDFQSYAVDLHGESIVSGIPSPLERLEWRELHGLKMPSLSPVDLLLGQGLHAFKHICGGYSRAAHLLEFRRHVLNLRDDGAFWRLLQVEARSRRQASLELGVVILLITRVMGDFAPQAFTMWTVDRLPRPVRLWIEMFGHRIALGSYPGDKLHLLLQNELEFTGTAQKRSLRQELLPLGLPSPVIQAPPNESLPAQIRRYFIYLQLIWARLRFHIVEGLRYAWESYRWRRQIDRFQS